VHLITTDDAVDRGRALEARVSEFFAHHGYRVRRNALMEGRSGATHEIDVLAEKDDALTTFRVAVECKAWALPVGKEVVAKLAFVLRDLALDKAIIVSLRGVSSGAAATAAELGVEAWGPAELAERLGETALAALGADATARTGAVGWPAAIDPDRGLELIAREARGVLGVGRERVVAVALVWLPWHLLRLAYAREEGRLRRRLRSASVGVMCDGLAGQVVRLTEPDGPAGLTAVDLGGDALPTLVRARGVQAEVRDAFERHAQVVTEAARARHRERLDRLGIPDDAQELTIEGATLIHQPLLVGLLRRPSGERAVAVDATTGRRDQELTDLLTRQLGAVVEVLERR
jgi:hypothetical protein